MCGDREDTEQGRNNGSLLLYESLLLILNPVLIGALGGKLIILVNPKRKAVA
jgi:hypothetical protein